MVVFVAMEAGQMRVAISEGREAIALTRAPVPEPGPGEVRVRVGACGICGSDLQLYRRGLFAPGITPGHEFAGWVDAVGDEVADVPSGDGVTIEPFLSCGRCPACRAGRDPICREAGLFGIHAPGGLAEYVVVPARRLFRVPSDLDPRLAALTEPMAVVVHGLDRGGLEPGQRVLILGAGAIGLLSVLAARARGAGEVWVTARHAHQAERARALGATRVIPEAEADVAALEALGRDAPIDLAIETVGGQANTLRAAAAALRPGGSISVLGLFMGPVELDPLPLLMKELTLAWSYCYTHGEERADFSDAAALIDRERGTLEPLITHTVSLEEAPRAFALAGDRKAGAVKVSVVP